jgi:hypothetical protein
MNNFDWTTFTLKIPVSARMQDLYDAWTRASEIEKWFLRKAVFTGNNEQPMDRYDPITKGGSYAWEWFGYDVVEKGRITAANGKDHMQFTFAGECPVDVRLKQEGEEVLVELTQSNIPTDDKSKNNIRLGCHQGWSFFLTNLKSVYEGGIDLRNKDARFKGVVNS